MAAPYGADGIKSAEGIPTNAAYGGKDRVDFDAKTDTQSSGNLSDTSSAGLSLMDKKMHIVNREFDQVGMGKYQWFIFWLCCFGFFLDLAWAQAYGIILAPLQRELGFATSQVGNISTLFSAGLTVGAFFWGIMVDVIGRKWAFYLTCLFASVWGIVLGGMNSYAALCGIAFLNGIGIGGNIPIDATILLEFLPTNRRFLLTGLSTFQPVGVVICSAIAYGIVPPYSCNDKLLSCNQNAPLHAPPGEACCVPSTNKGWRYLTFIIGGLTLACFFFRFVLFRFQESPKYLLSKGKDAEAVKSLQYIAKYNGKTTNISIEDFNACTESSDEALDPTATRFSAVGRNRLMTYLHGLKGLFGSKRGTRITLTIWTIYITQFWGFTMAGYLPYILAQKNVKTDVSIRKTFLNYIIIYSCGIPGAIIAAGLVSIRILGRKWSMFITSIGMALMCFLFTVVDTQAGNIAFNGLEYFFQTAFNAILYGSTPEYFPAIYRGTASGLAATCGRIMSFIAPQIGAHILVTSTNGVLYAAGGGVLVGTLAVFTLPSSAEPRGKELF